MQFCNYHTVYMARRAQQWTNETAAQFYLQQLQRDDFYNEHGATTIEHLVLLTEGSWYTARRPYYKVFPAFLDCLTKVRLDLVIDELPPMETPIAVRFQDLGNETTAHTINGLSLGSVLFQVTEVQRPAPGRLVIVSLCFRDALGYIMEAQAFRGFNQRTLQEWLDGIPARSVEEGISPLAARELLDAVTPEIRQHFSAFAMRICAGLLLLRQDPAFFTPDVLAADREKYSKTLDPKYIEKAKKRGVVGWSVGKEFETIPHWRRPHLALRHTGKGRTIPKIVPVKGTIVHRERIDKIPTGHLTPEGVEIETAD